MNVRTVAAAMGGVVTSALPIFRLVERVIGWAGLPNDLRTWRTFFHAVFGAAPMFELVLLGFGVLCLGIALWCPWRKTGDHRRPQLYLSLTADRQPDKHKIYYVSWSPTRCLGMKFSNYTEIGASLRKDKPEEKSFSLYLFNSGPEDVRHIRLVWEIPGLDVCAAVRDTGLFGGCVEEISRQHIRLQAMSRGSVRPLARRQDEKIPLLKAGGTIRIDAPEAITGAAAIAFLACAKTIRDRPLELPISPEPSAVLKLMERLERPMPRVSIVLKYAIGEGPEIEQKFALIGTLRAGEFMYKVEGEESTWASDEEGLTATLCGLRIVET